MPKNQTRRNSSSDPFVLDVKAAGRVKDFFSTCLVHSKGEWAGQPFDLARWQYERILKPLFGIKRRHDGLRRYRKCYVEVPRKNGKSTLAAGVGNYLLFADGEPGAEIYSAAADRDQAAIVFEEAKRMAEGNRQLREQAEIYRRSLVVPATHSSYKVLSSDAFTKHGLNAHGIIFDELHTQPNRDLYDVLTTSTGSRRQPIEFYITTAGYDRHSICYELHDYAQRVLRGVIDDPSFLPVIFAADEQDDWTDPRVWGKANPNLGVSKKRDYMANECKKAQAVPAYENTFRRLELDQWTKQDVRWMPMTYWNDAPAREPESALVGRVCYSGLDLASTTDVAALAHVFPADDGFFDVVMRFWIPEEAMEARSKRDRVPYDVWVRQELIDATPGNVIDYAYILNTIDEDAQLFDLSELAFDRWGATKIIQEIEERGLTVVQFGQGYASMGSPTKELLKLVLSGKLRHGHNPVLTWMADNVVVEQDPAGNLKPSKRKSTEKIDGIVALIMALDRALRNEAHGSKYEREDVLVV